MNELKCPKCQSVKVSKTGFGHGIGTGGIPPITYIQYRCGDCEELFYPNRPHVANETEFENLDTKIKSLLNELNDAQKRCEKFSRTKPLDPEENFKSTDKVAMQLAYASRARIKAQLQLAYAEKNPEDYNPEGIEKINEEIKMLTDKIRAWQNGQSPSNTRL